MCLLAKAITSYLCCVNLFFRKEEKPCCPRTGAVETKKSLDRENGETNPQAETPRFLARSASEWVRVVEECQDDWEMSRWLLWKNKEKQLYMYRLFLRYHVMYSWRVNSASTFEVFLLTEAQRDLTAVASGALTVLCDAKTEAGHAVITHTKVPVAAITC